MTVKLTQPQESLVHQLQHLALSSVSHLPSTLIYGPAGAGKRRVVSQLADDFGLEMVEINVSDSAEFVATRLFGTSSNRVVGEPFGAIGGELGRSGEAIVYLSAFDGLSHDEAFHQALYRMLSKRTFVDLLGDERRMSDGLWIIAAMRESRDSTSRVSVDLNHWLCTHFEHQLRLGAPSTLDELGTIVDGMLQEYGCSVHELPASCLLEMVRDAPDGLRALRRWVASAARSRTKDAVVSGDNFMRAVIHDLETVCSQLRYCGHALDVLTFERWAAQFGELQSVAVHLLRWISREYFISDREYFTALDALIRRSGIARRSRVIFCKWQSEGQSGPRVANQIKNRAHWRVDAGYEIDLTRDETDWPQLDGNISYQLVLVDDFVGSGQTISRLFVGDDAPLRRLLVKLPHARLWIGIIVGFDMALRDAHRAIGEYGSRVTVTPYRLLTEQDKCFSDTTRIFANPATRSKVKEFCLQAARMHYPELPRNLRLGFNDTAALVVFYDTVPNNSLPIIWHNEGTWLPLFPASGLPVSSGAYHASQESQVRPV